MSWLIPGERNDAPKRLNRTAEWMLYLLWLIPLAIVPVIVLLTPLIHWLREAIR